MFEIVLKQDYEDIFFFREFEINGITTSPGRITPGRMSPHRPSSRSRSNTPNRNSMMMQSVDGTRTFISSPMKDSDHAHNPSFSKVTRII